MEEDIIDIFPELRESDDERIRKGIIYVLEQEWVHLVSAKGVTKKEMIAWLEKQGEQKPTLRERYENIAKSEWFKKNHVGISIGEQPLEEDVVGMGELGRAWNG